MRTPGMFRLVHFSAIILTALISVPGLSHLFSLSSKMKMDETAYFNAQGAYRAWSLFAIPIFVVILLDSWLAFSARDDGPRFHLFGFAGLAIACTLIIFFLWVFPGNQATANWIEVPSNWRELRMQWEYGHAASAVITFTSLLAVTAAAFLPANKTP